MSNSTKPYSILCPIFNEDYIIKKETREDGSIRHYCNDRDCTVEPHDPECNYDD